MWKWLFSKVIKMREKVAIDLGEEDAEKPFLEHLEDLRTMLVRMAMTLAGVCRRHIRRSTATFGMWSSPTRSTLATWMGRLS